MLFPALKEFDSNNWRQNYSIMHFFWNTDSQWITGFSIVKYEIFVMSVFEDVFSLFTRSICKFSDMLYFLREF